MKWLCLILIDFYQRFISPYKGFRCAYAVAYSSASCSDAVKDIIATEGVLAGIPLIRARFNACSLAYASMRNNENQRRQGNNACTCRNVVESAVDVFGECAIDGVSNFSCNACEVGSACDVGSCSL